MANNSFMELAPVRLSPQPTTAHSYSVLVPLSSDLATFAGTEETRELASALTSARFRGNVQQRETETVLVSHEHGSENIHALPLMFTSVACVDCDAVWLARIELIRMVDGSTDVVRDLANGLARTIDARTRSTIWQTVSSVGTEVRSKEQRAARERKAKVKRAKQHLKVKRAEERAKRAASTSNSAE